MSQETKRPLTRRLAWWVRRFAGPAIKELQARLAKANTESDALRLRLHREVTEHNRTLQKINDLEAKVSVLLDECTPEETQQGNPLFTGTQQFPFTAEHTRRAAAVLATGEIPPQRANWWLDIESTPPESQSIFQYAWDEMVKGERSTPEAMAMPPVIVGNLDSDRFQPWWETQGCRIEAITQEDFARQVWDAAEVRTRLEPKRDILEGVLP